MYQFTTPLPSVLPKNWNPGGMYIEASTFADLPTGNTVRHGTWAYVVDTQTCYMYDAESQTWMEQ